MSVSSSRRRFLEISAGLAGKVAATGAVSLPVLASRDLYLSPSHSLLVDGFLIPVEMLVNGKSIAPAMMDHHDVIDYFHVELETHEVIFAEGTPAETLLVTDDRETFANFLAYERLYGADECPA